MSRTDGQPNFPVDVEQSGHHNFTPEQKEKLKKNMIKYLSQDSTSDKMRMEHMRELLAEDGWHERVSKEMTRVVSNCDVTKKPYIDMLKDLGHIPFKPEESRALDESNDVHEKAREMKKTVKELVQSPQFEMKEGLKERLFEKWDILFQNELRQAYFRSLPAPNEDDDDE